MSKYYSIKISDYDALQSRVVAAEVKNVVLERENEILKSLVDEYKAQNESMSDRQQYLEANNNKLIDNILHLSGLNHE